MAKSILEPLISIVILNYNSGLLLTGCIESIKNCKYKNYEIILVDNASSDNSHLSCKERYPEINLIQNKETDVAATKICKVALRMHQCSNELAPQRLWWITSAVAQALAIGALPTSAGLASLI